MRVQPGPGDTQSAVRFNVSPITLDSMAPVAVVTNGVGGKGGRLGSTLATSQGLTALGAIGMKFCTFAGL
jgi:hypothetical protein